MHKLPHLYKNRFGTYYLRVYHSGSERKKSLGTKDFSEAKYFALLFNLEVCMSKPKLSDFSHLLKNDADIRKAYKLDIQSGHLAADTPEDHRNAMEAIHALTKLAKVRGATQNNVNNSKPQIVGGLKLSQVVKDYLIEKQLDNKPKTLEDKERAFAEFAGLFGDLAIESIQSDQAGAYKSRLLAKNISGIRINTKLSFFADLFEYAIDNGKYFSANPFKSIRVSKGKKLKAKSESYEPFTEDELNLIFAPAKYEAFLKKSDYHWLPFLALYTGARLEDLASLTIDQIKQEHGIWYIQTVIANAKNKNSVRKIPLHDVILASGFLAYVNSVKAKYQIMLFPHLKPSKNGYGKNTSRRFAAYLDEIGIVSPLKVFHSFRSTFINRLSEFSVHPAVLMSLVGHIEQSKVDLSSPHFAVYQHTKPLEVLQKTVNLFNITIPKKF
jgi:integrase